MAYSVQRMKKHRKRGATTAKFVVCIKNRGYPASLEKRKLYRVIPDRLAEHHGTLRIIDESGEDYLYPKAFFAAVPLPVAARRAVMAAA